LRSWLGCRLLAAVPGTGTLDAQPVEKAFVQGGRITLNLVAGDYRITGRPDNKIRVAWRSDKGDADPIRASADISGSSATIQTAGKNHSVHFDVDVPARSDLDVDLSAGDLIVNGIEGNKTIGSWAGDMSIDVGRADLYKDVDVSVRAGDLSAPPFNVATGGLFRSFHWTGHGKYFLKIKLFAGDLTLH
jgi:hypothetical protein